jgi:YidC/Oxa1 family membrane protein insertase
MIAEKLQQAERNKQNQLRPSKNKINAVFKGDKRYMLLATLYRQNNYHPIHALRSSLGLLIQVPFFIAAYHYISNLEILNGQSFLFINNLGEPDSLIKGINILPIIMTVINIISGIIYTSGFSKQDKIQIHCLAALFLILLYNSPAALVLYWTCNNIFNLVKNILIKYKNSNKYLYCLTIIFSAVLIIYSLFLYNAPLVNRIFTVLIILFILSAPVWKKICLYMSSLIKSFLATENTGFINMLYYVISVLAPNIFLFNLLIRNTEFVFYSHFLIVAFVFSILGFLLHFIVSFIWKSAKGSAFVCLFLWTVFFTIVPVLYQNILFNYILELRIRYHFLIFLIISIPIFVFSIIIFKYTKRIKIIFIKYLCAFLVIIFLFNFIQSTYVYFKDKSDDTLIAFHKTSFYTDNSLPSPNIYWLHTDGMLGFKAMEQFFYDTQVEFEEQLILRDFIINKDNIMETGYTTSRSFAALVSPFFYDNVMLPVLKEEPINYLINKRVSHSLFNISSQNYFHARVNNELIMAFAQKDYYTTFIGKPGYYFPPITKSFYTESGRLDYSKNNIKITEKLDKLLGLNELICNATPLYMFRGIIRDSFLLDYIKKHLATKEINKTEFDLATIYGDLYNGNDTWHINALNEIYLSQQPRIVIIEDSKTHFPYILAEDGSSISRTPSEIRNITHYPPQHNYTSKYIINLIDFILKNDPDAVIVIQADHGLTDDSSRNHVLSYGGTEAEISLLLNQVMSAVHIPEKWGGLEKPLHPLNITRELVNRYVGHNYELITE